MAEFLEVIKIKKRMCETYSKGCFTCPMNYANNGEKMNCTVFIYNHPVKAEKIIMEWADEYPVKTNADKFKEVFGFNIETDICTKLGSHQDCNDLCIICELDNFWNKEYKEQDKEQE